MIHDGAQEPREERRATQAPDGRPAAEQPRWRRDFPVDWPDDEYVSRRDLVKFLVLVSGAFAAGQVWIFGESLRQRRSAAIPAAAVASLDEIPVGGAKTFHYPEGSPARLLVRTGERTFVAYDQQCTHLQCPVIPVVASGRLHCPCHNGWFDLASGRPVAGPPRRPLARVTLEIRDGRVWATGVQESAS